MTILGLKPGGLYFLEFLHDSWCPTLTTGKDSDCQCRPTWQLHQDAAHFVRTEALGREQRRNAQREAAKALRKAKRGAR